MKAGVSFCAILLSLVSLSATAPTGNQDDFSKCQEVYNSVIGHIVASSGVEATETIWRLVFHYLDLDGNDQVTSAEIALFLEKESYVHESDVMAALSQARSWIKTSDSGDEQLSRDEFVNIVQKTIGQDTESDAKYAEVVGSMCHLFTNKLPHLAEVMTELETCTKHLEESIMTDETERAEFNSWFAIFKTLDGNQDKKIDFEELKKSIGHVLTDEDGIALASALGHAIYGKVHHDVKDITEKHFYIFAHELLYGVRGTDRKNVWEDITSEEELRGRSMLCKAIYDVRIDLVGQRDIMDDCINSYTTTRQKILGADGVFAPEIVFTMADADKDGEISHEEFDAFIGAPSTLYNTVGRKHAAKEMKIDEFRSVMPDRIVEAKLEGGVKGVLESSSMTSSELQDAEKLCAAIISSVQKYPADGAGEQRLVPASGSMSFKGMGEYIFREHTLPEDGSSPSIPPPSTPETETFHIKDHNGNPLEITINHPSGGGEHNAPAPSSQSFKGLGEYIWKERTLPHEDTKPTEAPITPEASPSESIVYHMVDAHGNPIELTFNQREIDDITHRMTMAQQTPIEREEAPTDKKPMKPSAKATPDSEDNELLREVEKILEERERTEPVGSTQSTSQDSSETEEEKELKKLLEDMENVKTKGKE